MKRLLSALRRDLWWWLAPMLVLFGLLAYLAWKQTHVPNAPFTYEIR